MAWYKCIGSSGGSGEDINEIITITEDEFFHGGSTVVNHTYEVLTVSNGQSDATIKLIERDENDNIVWETNVLYSSVSSNIYKVFGSIKLNYASSSWNLIAVNEVTYNGNVYSSGDQIFTWSYSTSVDYTDIVGIGTSHYLISNNKIYLVTNNQKDQIRYKFKGNERMLRKNDISNYQFWFEDLYYPRNAYNTVYYDDYRMIQDWDINDSEHRGEPWQLEFNVCPIQDGNSSYSELSVFASSSTSEPRYEFYINKSSLGFYMWGNGLPDSNLGNITNKDVIIKFENGYITTTIDGVQVDSRTYNITRDSTSKAVVGGYRESYLFSGFMNYIGFKWLNQPTPSGADGLSYDLSTNGNTYELTIVEYDNGVQSDTTTLSDTDVMSADVVFGDLCIGYNTSDDTFVIKPNYNDNKSIKYNDVIYNGNNEILSMASYTTNTVNGLLGWIE